MRREIRVPLLIALTALLATACEPEQSAPSPAGRVQPEAPADEADEAPSWSAPQPDPRPAADDRGAVAGEPEPTAADDPPPRSGGPSAMDDACPPATPPITADVQLQGQTSQQGISGACGASSVYSQAVTVTLAERRAIELTVTSDAPLTVLTVRDGCAARGCKAGDARQRMTYTTSVKEPGSYNVVVNTSRPAAFSLDVRLVTP